MGLRESTGLALLAVGLAACSGLGSEGSLTPGAGGVTDGPSASILEASPTEAARQVSAEQRGLIAADLAGFAKALGIESPPQVEIVRVLPDWEAPVVQAECMNEQGWAWSADGSTGPELTSAAQREAHDLAWYVCKAQFPSNPDHNLTKLSDGQKKVAYEYYAVTLVECLRGQGETIEDVPSERTFIDRFDVEGPWNAYRQLNLTRAELQRLEEACPMNVPGEMLWGE